MKISQILPKISRKYQQHKELSQNKEILKKNSVLAGTRTGKTCFIIANGPSLKDQDLKSLADKETFVVNSFWLHPEYEIIRPKYYVTVDTPHLSNKDPNRPFELFEEDLTGRNLVVSQVPETKLFFSVVAEEYIKNNKLFTENPKYYIFRHGTMDENLRFNMDPTIVIPFTKNVIILAIMLAVYMGFETIYLLGCDNNLLAYPSEQAVTNYKHFYNEPPGHIPDSWNKTKYENLIASTLILFQNYRFLREKIAKEYPQVKIYNATPNSFLDVFPFVKFDDIK